MVEGASLAKAKPALASGEEFSANLLHVDVGNGLGEGRGVFCGMSVQENDEYNGLEDCQWVQRQENIEQILCKIGAQSSRMPCRDSEGVLAV